MDCPNIKECQLLKLKDDLGLIILDKDFDLESIAVESICDRFEGIESLSLVRDDSMNGLGRLYFRGIYLCDTLENPDFFMPTGTYPLKISYSPHFKTFLPEVVIEGHSGVRIHAANSVKDLKGCFGVGVRLSSGALLGYSTITLDRIIYNIKSCNIRYFKIC